MLETKKADLFGSMFIVVVTLIVFFALYPAVKTLLDVAIGVNAGVDPTADFLIGSVGFVMLFGMLKWIYNTIGGGSDE